MATVNKAVIAADREARSSRKFFDDMDRLFGASIGVVVIRTREIERARALTHEWCSLQGYEFHAWDHNHGIRRYAAMPTTEEDDSKEIQYDSDRLAELLSPSSTIENTQALVAALDHMEEQSRSSAGEFESAFILGVLEPIEDELRNPALVQHVRDQILRSHDSDDRLFFFVQPHTELPEDFKASMTLIDLDPPSFIELVDTLTELNDTSIKEALDHDLDEDAIEEISQNGLGMTEEEFSNAVAIAVVELAKNESEEPSTADFVKIVRQNKLELIRQTEVLDLVLPAPIESVGGLDLLKEDLTKRRLAFSPRALEFGLSRPKGFIVVGPPGTGKTLICKATSSVLGLPAIIFNLSAVFSSYIGSSEQRLRANLKFVEDMAPCIMFLDEFDKAVPQGNENDSGTSSRILGTLLTWLNDRQERGIPVYVIASANDVSRLPPEVMRKGRFDDIWAVGNPSDKERAAILRIHVEKRGHELTAKEYKGAALASKGFVGAELESVIEEALMNDFYAENDALTYDNVIAAIEATTPQSKAFPERTKFMKEWAEQNARIASSGGTFDVPEDQPAPKGGRRIRKPVKRRPSTSRED